MIGKILQTEPLVGKQATKDTGSEMNW